MEPRRIKPHSVSRMFTGTMMMSNPRLPMGWETVLRGDINEHLKKANSSCKASICDNELILVGPPLDISEAYSMAMEVLCKRLQLKVQLLRRTTTTTKDYDHELRTTTTTNYDCDEIRLRRLQYRGLASIGAFVKIMINTSYDYHELLIRRTMSTMEYDYDDDSTTTATFCSYIVGGGRLRKCTFARFGHAVRRDNRGSGKTN